MNASTHYRSHNCGELTEKNIDKEVTICGWVAKVRDFGGLTFVDIRDRYGITQLAFNIETNEALCLKARGLGREYVVQAKGKVIERSNKNKNIATGDIEIEVTDLQILNESITPPFTIENDTDGGEELRMKYRYLDIRRPILNERLVTRARVVKAMRAYLDERDFTEIETPVLIKSTPEGARDFLVPSRMQPGNFYALPQSPQILKQLLMVAGMDRYYQVVKCYRDEDFRGDRQPEFTQLDCEMSFVNQEDVLQTFEGLTKYVFKEIKNIDLPDIIRLPYADAIKYYGSDKPDLRFDCKIIDIDALDAIKNNSFPLFQNASTAKHMVSAIVAKGCAAMSRKQTDEMVDYVKMPNRGLSGLIQIKVNEDGTIKSTIDKFMNETQLQEIAQAVQAEKGDLILIAVEKESKVRKALGDLRLELAKKQNWIDKDKWSLLWIVDFPLFELDEETGAIIFVHHPFCNIHPEDVAYFDTDPLKCRAQQYDLVINGAECLSGSIRIHNKELQDKVFQKLGFSEAEKEERFGFMVNAFQYGAPPHGGCAFGVDRWVALLTGAEVIRDVIAFPKNNSGRDLMMDAPSVVDPKQLKELGINIQ
ncbi:MAG: aspartate--tRNA ligase [Bacteroidota bacterium]